MKNKLYYLIFITFILIIGITYILFNHFFPLANPIDYPEDDAINSHTVLYDNRLITSSDLSFESIFTHIKTAKPTRKITVNDFPTIYPYFEVNVYTNSQAFKYFIYQEDNTTYLEMPYYGVYVLHNDVFELLNSLKP